MSAQQQALTTNELLVEILRHLPAHDLNRARNVNKTWLAIITGTAGLERIRCLKPFDFANAEKIDWQEFDRRFRQAGGVDKKRPVMPRRSEEFLYYVVPDRRIKFHADIRPRRGFFRRYIETTASMCVPRTGKRSVGLKDHRQDLISHPPITTLSITMELVRRRGPRPLPSPEVVSQCVLRVKGGIKIGDIMDVQKAMRESEGGCKRGGDNMQFECRVQDFCLVHDDNMVVT